MISSAMEKSLFEEDKYADGAEAGSSLGTDDEDSDLKAKKKEKAKEPISKRMATGKITVRGSIPATDQDDSLDSDLDLEGEEGSDLDSEDELELMNLAAGRGKTAIESKVNKPESDDDDF